MSKRRRPRTRCQSVPVTEPVPERFDAIEARIRRGCPECPAELLSALISAEANYHPDGMPPVVVIDYGRALVLMPDGVRGIEVLNYL